MNPFRAERLLARTFFGRLFESDKIPPGLPQVQIVIWGIAAFAAPAYLLSFVLAIKLPAYAMAFSLYAYSGAALEERILERPLLLGGFFIAVTLVAAGFAYLRRRNLQPPPGLRYEEEDYDAIFRGFNLSEALPCHGETESRLARCPAPTMRL